MGWREAAVAGVLALLTGTMLVFLGVRPPTFDWQACEGPDIGGSVDLADLGVSDWPGPRLVAELEAEVGMAVAYAESPGGDRFVTSLEGRLYRLPEAEPPVVVLDLSDRVLVGEEQGLLGVTTSPDGRYLYLTYTDREGTLRLVEYDVPGFSESREVLAVPQPDKWHNGGNLAFGPDGHLYLGLGDGGGTGDPFRNGQNPASVLGTVLRVDPRPDGATGYRVPDGNPFPDSAAPLVYVYGLRNPWGMAFDRLTGDLWIGDVGQSCFEEIDVIRAGSGGGHNLGWSRLEGTMRFGGDLPDQHVRPVLTYSHDFGGCAITGGFVYRGTAIPELEGRYLFADYCRGDLMAMELDGDRPRAVHALAVRVPLLTAIAQDGSGEIVLLSRHGGVYRVTAPLG